MEMEIGGEIDEGKGQKRSRMMTMANKENDRQKVVEFNLNGALSSQ